jgi:hypothetical protein
MKVYFYDRESGIYQGEGFEEDLSVLEGNGVTVVAPPPYEKGFVPVFDQSEGRWNLKRNGVGGAHFARAEPICRIVKPPE